MTNRADWTAPWIGGVASLMEKHFDELGWASDAPGWSPMARLTAKPAYQKAMAGSLGDYITLMNTQAHRARPSTPILKPHPASISSEASANQLRAARDALTKYDRRMHRRDISGRRRPSRSPHRSA